MSYEGVSNCNIYAAWAVMRPDLRPDERGKETDVIAVLAAVGDLDTDKGESVPLENLPIKPSIVVESSEGNFQPDTFLKNLCRKKKAKPILTALSQIVGGDAGQDVASHLWRVPGTLNWPTKSKLKRGKITNCTIG